MDNEEVEALKNGLRRERLARKLAEKILESKSTELFNLNQKLIKSNSDLELKVAERTKEYERIARFPEENPSPVIRVNNSGEIKYLNRPAKSMFEDIKSSGIDVKELFTVWAQDALHKPKNSRKELGVTDKSYSISIVPIREHGYVNFYCSEITEQKIAEDKLIRSEVKYRSIIENMQLGLLEVDKNHKITKAYHQFCTFTGYSEDELIGNKAIDILSHKESIQVIEENTAKRGNGLETVYEAQIVKKDGTNAWVLISGAPLYDDYGEEIGSIGIHLDITDSKNLEKELIKARYKAEETSRTKEQFLANMSHEIRTPLNAIVGMTRLLINTKINSEQEKLLHAMDLSSQNLLVVINDILDLSKIESGHLQLERIGFKVTDIVKHIVVTKKLHTDEKGIILEHSIAENISEVLIGDPFRLNQILLNLVNNAIKFTDVGGVKIIVKSIFEDEHRQTLQFNILDTGKGIASDKIDLIFEAFNQEDESITRNYGGTGLGLTITKKMVDMQTGDLTVSSELNVGSDFQFTIPYLKGSDKDLPELSLLEVDTNQLDGLKILLAEDNEFNQTLMETIFHQFDVELDVVQNGQKVLDALVEKKYDIILMDIQMPVMDGVQATILIRKDENLKDIPIIALTANAFKDELEKYRQFGMDDCLSKPFNADELYGKILRLTGRDVLKVNPETKKETTTEDLFLYDLKNLSKMMGGNVDLVKKMVDSFLEHTPNLVDDLIENAQKGDWSTVSKICHRLKASCKTISIGILEEPIHSLEVDNLSLSNSDKEKHLELIEVTMKDVFHKLRNENFQNLE